MCVGPMSSPTTAFVLLIFTLLCGAIAYPATPHAQRPISQLNSDMDLNQDPSNRISNDDDTLYHYQHHRYSNDDEDDDDDDPPRRLPYFRFLNNEDEIDNHGFDKRGGGPSLSIVNPLDVLRQRLILEMARRKQKENLNRIEANAHLLNSIGKRSTRQKDPPTSLMAAQHHD